MQVGDRLTSVNSISMEDTKSLTRQQRAAVGEVRTWVVDRNGEPVTLQVENVALPGTQSILAFVGILLGLCFLGCGLWAFIANPRPATLVLAVFGLSFGVAFSAGPYFASLAVRTAVGSVLTAAVVMGFAALVHFLLSFPSRRPILGRSGGTGLVYGPAVAVALLIIGFNVFQPAATSGINVLFRTVIGLFIAGYFITALVTLIQSYLRADAATRAANGLGIMLGGAVLGLGPLIVSAVIGLVSPQTVLPGSQYYFLTLALIPITFAMASVKAARTA